MNKGIETDWMERLSMPTPNPSNPAQPPAPLSVAPPSNTIYTSQPAWLDWSWPPFAIVAIVIGFTFATGHGEGSLSAVLNKLSHAPVAQATARDRILIITSNSKKQRNMILTLSPRGLVPLVAQGMGELSAIVPRYESCIDLVVIDENVPEAPEIARSVRNSFPPNRIIILKPSTRAEDIGPVLLDRL